MKCSPIGLKGCLVQGARASTPSRLQQASTAAPRQPVHDLQGTLAGRLLAEAGITDSAHLSEACSHPDQAVSTMTSKSASSFLVSLTVQLPCGVLLEEPSAPAGRNRVRRCHRADYSHFHQLSRYQRYIVDACTTSLRRQSQDNKASVSFSPWGCSD